MFENHEGLYSIHRNALVKTCKIGQLLNVTHMGQIGDAIQQVTFRLGRIQMILDEFDKLTREKVLIRLIGETDQFATFNFTLMQKKESFSFYFNYKYPFLDWKTNVPCQFGRITQICQ